MSHCRRLTTPSMQLARPNQRSRAAIAQRQGDQINRLTLVSLIFLPLTFITGFFGMNFGWMVDRIDTQVAFWLLGFVVPAATAALAWRLLVRRFVIGDRSARPRRTT
jgi:Mg2+ and Co2+ transporter CorA